MSDSNESLFCISHLMNQSGVDSSSNVRLNNDSSGTDGSSGNYATRNNTNGGNDSTQVHQTEHNNGYGGALERLQIDYISNVSGQEKLIITNGMGNDTSGQNNVYRYDLGGKWDQTEVVTKVENISSGSGVWQDGTNLTVLSPDVGIPALGTNVQDNTLFVEKDTAYRYWFDANPLVDDNFSSSSGWNQVTNTASGVVDGQLIGLTNSSGTNGAGAWKDYGLVSDTKFVLRCKFQIVTQSGGSGNASTLYFGISDTNGITSPHSNRDGFGIAITNYASSGMLWLYPNGTTWDNADTDLSLTPTQTTYYLEIARTSATSVTFKLFSDEYSTVVKTHTQTIASTLNGLRYIMFQEWRNSSGNTTKVAVDDLQIWNGVATASGGGEWKFQFSLADLKAYWKMGEIGGNLVNHATSIGSKSAMSADLVSSGTVNRGRTGHVAGVDCIGFPTYDADGNKVTANNSASDYGFMNKAGAKFTACWWARNYSYNNVVDLWGLGGNGNAPDINFRQRGQSGFTVWFSGTEYTGFSTPVSSNGWYFYMLSWDEDGVSNNAQVQINGTKQTATVTTTNTSNANSPLIIGDVSGNEPQMDIQEFSLWNRILTDTEIAHIYNAGVGRQL